MSRFVWAAIVAVFAVMAVTGPVKMLRFGSSEGDESPDEAAPAEGDRVGMAGLAFDPAELTVSRGTEVVFDNDDAAPHTVTSADESIDSGILNPGKAFQLTVNETFDYKCLIHPSMTARILVSG